MPLAFTAAWATWLSRRRLGRWPFGERGPSLTCALSCAPGRRPPRGERARGRNGRGGGAHLGQDRRRRVHPEPRAPRGRGSRRPAPRASTGRSRRAGPRPGSRAEVGLFQQGLQPVLELDPVARQLDLRAGPRPLQAAARARARSLGSSPGRPRASPAIRRRRSRASAPRRASGLGLLRRGRVPALGPAPGRGPGARPPVPFQGGPDGPPVWRRRFPDDFVNLALAEPVGQQAQRGGVVPNGRPANDRSTKRSTLPLLAAAIIAQGDFHEVSRAGGPP